MNEKPSYDCEIHSEDLCATHYTHSGASKENSDDADDTKSSKISDGPIKNLEELGVTVYLRDGLYYWTIKSEAFKTFSGAAFDAMNALNICTFGRRYYQPRKE